MKVKDLPKDTDLESVWVLIPRQHRATALAAGLTECRVHIHSIWAQGVWVKVLRTDSRVYPLQVIPSEILEWELAGV